MKINSVTLHVCEPIQPFSSPGFKPSTSTKTLQDHRPGPKEVLWLLWQQCECFYSDPSSVVPVRRSRWVFPDSEHRLREGKEARAVCEDVRKKQTLEGWKEKRNTIFMQHLNKHPENQFRNFYWSNWEKLLRNQENRQPSSGRNPMELKDDLFFPAELLSQHLCSGAYLLRGSELQAGSELKSAEETSPRSVNHRSFKRSDPQRGTESISCLNSGMILRFINIFK